MHYKIILSLNDTAVDPAELDLNNLHYLENYHAQFPKDVSFYLYYLNSPFLSILAITSHLFDKSQSIQEATEQYLSFLPPIYKSFDIQPILYTEYSRLIDRITDLFQTEPENAVFLVDDFELDKHLVPLEIGKFSFKEAFAIDQTSKLQHESISSFQAEKDRILSVTPQPFVGHPLHYHLQSESFEEAENIAQSLIPTLVSQKRLLNHRFVKVSVNPRYRTSDDLTLLVGQHMASGGSILFDCSTGFELNDTLKLTKQLNELSQSIYTAQHEVLFFFYSHPKNTQLFDLFEQTLNLNIVTLQPEMFSYLEAQQYLENHFTLNHLDITRLSFLLSKSNDQYTFYQLNQILNHEIQTSLVQTNFASYAKCFKVSKQVNTPITQNGQIELNQLIGLQSVKRKIQEIVQSNTNLKHLSSTFGMSSFSNHMAFIGNPGTAKTTVARLIGKIFKENNLLSVGDFYELTRSDLIERYVGWTAKNIHDVFEKAKGSVLFIDEAYSLMDQGYHGYGEEAISTILQEMENNRDNMVVIFAGYPEKMEQFIHSNPGLKSRIKHFVQFDDYSLHELLKIAHSMLKQHHCVLSQEARLLLTKHLVSTLNNANFGNARDVRNLIEQAITAHLSTSNFAQDSELNPLCLTLSEDDFYFIKESKNQSIRLIN